MEVIHGYKRTEVGVIPCDWDCRRICDLARLESGHTPKRTIKSYWNGPIPWVSLHDTDSLDRNYIYDTAMNVTQNGIDNSSARILPVGTVVFSRTATVGKASLLGREMATSQDFANYVCGPQLCNLYVVYLFREMARTWESLKAGSTHQTIYMPAFEKLQIPVPPVSEQRAIAAALSDVDALLGGLDRLIAKKRDLKQAAIQRLLTGQVRLSGYGEKWEVRQLGKYATNLRHGVNSRAELVSEGRVKYLHYGDIHASKAVHLSPEALPCLPETKAAALDRLQDGDLVIADASEDLAGVSKSVEIKGIGDTELVAGLHTIALRFDRELFADGFKGYLQFCSPFSTQLRRLAAGTKVYATSRSHISSVEMCMPPVAEQTAIAAVLADMDLELVALAARRDKTRNLKRAMMQDLLTGRTRLLRPEDGGSASC